MHREISLGYSGKERVLASIDNGSRILAPGPLVRLEGEDGVS
jgi:hypothetical protein